MRNVRDVTLELYTQINLRAAPNGPFATSLSDSTGLAGAVAHWNALLDRLDPTFLAEVEKIDRDDGLSPVGKRKALITVGLSAAKDVEKFRTQHIGVLAKRIAETQGEITIAVRKVFAPPTDPGQVTALATRLANFAQNEITALYVGAEPSLQVAIEAVGALTGGKIPLHGGAGWPQWVDMIPEAIRSREAANRNAQAAPAATKLLADLSSFKDAYTDSRTHTPPLQSAPTSSCAPSSRSAGHFRRSSRSPTRRREGNSRFRSVPPCVPQMQVRREPSDVAGPRRTRTRSRRYVLIPGTGRPTSKVPAAAAAGCRERPGDVRRPTGLPLAGHVVTRALYASIALRARKGNLGNALCVWRATPQPAAHRPFLRKPLDYHGFRPVASAIACELNPWACFLLTLVQEESASIVDRPARPAGVGRVSVCIVPLAARSTISA